MTIQTLTNNPLDALGAAPPDFPDVASLAQLANAFFQALPGSEALVAVPPARASQPDLQLGGPSAQLTPAVEPGSLTAGAPAAPAGVSPQFGRSVAPELPAGFAPALPLEALSPAHEDPVGWVSGSPRHPTSAAAQAYYFLGEGQTDAVPSALPDAGGTENRVTPQPFELPGSGELERVLDTLFVDAPAPAKPSAPAAGQFYFLEQNAPSLEKAPDAAGQPVARVAFDVQAVRRDFPILAERVNGKPLVWFDNAATTQKPQAVIDRLAYFYAHENSNIHRAAHELAARATDAYEGARDTVARFLGAKSAQEIVFVRGATEAINLVANTYGRQHIGEGDEIVVSLLEHHANIVPWQQLAAATGAKIRVIPVDDSGQILLEEYAKLLNPRTKLVALTQVSNALGTVTPVREIVALAHGVGARVLVDGAQAVSHFRVNVQALDADFYVFSGHKVFAPTGIGALYGKLELLESLPPWQGGGNMIADVTFEKTTYQGAPARFEAGTGNIADAVGLGAAIDYLERIGFDAAGRYEHDLLRYATHGLQTVPGLRLIGTARDKASVLSFVLAGYRTEEVGAALNREGIAVRSGHHCAQPILRRFGLEATVRPSLAFYNTCEEVDLLVATLHRLARGQRSSLN
ncbi:family 2A encapsulin nanocompartment cargo protein cysteine desulfurase [Methylogaea oryzae]|uniref:Cysteine desulfurase n=1 Tax=Methylogaea oryzae TaxID=1295382 RepID=A0A8D4VNY1_9GAMM|nr:family 2A encapsulin nanocompartment cargo protein cysteine desulfurase [Methylogaea oryzae]BBL71375.1 cysteine desulfurase [Methylogaea oryzae]